MKNVRSFVCFDPFLSLLRLLVISRPTERARYRRVSRFQSPVARFDNDLFASSWLLELRPLAADLEI